MFLQKLAKKGNILLEQTAQALIRLHRYLGTQSQWTMCAFCSLFLDVAQQKHRWCHLSHDTVLGKMNKVTPQAHSRIMIGAIVSTFKEGTVTEQHGLWIDCILTEELTMCKMIPTAFVLTLPNILGHKCTCIKSNDQSKKISNDQELIQSDPTSCPQNQKGNN